MSFHRMTPTLFYFTFKTGTEEYKDYVLLYNPYANDDKAIDEQYEYFNKWFPNQYPESELISVVNKTHAV